MPKYIPIKPASFWKEIRSTDKDWKQVGSAKTMQMLRHLHLIRAFEETVLDLDGQGLVHGPAHSSIGQDGSAVGAIAPLRSSDQITGSHRGHHQFLAKALRHVDKAGTDHLADPLSDDTMTILHRALAEIMGLSDGYCKGRGGSMHLRWEEAGALGTNAIVGGGVPIANGVAWANKRKGNGDVAFTFMGDGAVNIGAVPESMNLAALWDLPICFFIENNGFAVSTRLDEETRETRLSSRGIAYGIPALRVDGMDPVAVSLAAQEAVDMMRAGKGPVIIEAILYRYFHHGGGIDGSAFGYRSKKEEAEWRKRDPLIFLAKGMIDRGWLDKKGDANLREMAQQGMSEVMDRLTVEQGNQRTIIESLWPKPEFRDEGLRGDLSEFNGARFEEAETFSGAVADVKFIDVVSKVMERRMETDERIFSMGEDIHRLKGGTNGATKGLHDRFPDRIIGTPIAEQGFTGLAGGVAMEGTYRPVVELMYADFALVAADQIFNQIAKARHMFGGETPMPIVLRTKCAIGTGYGQQHSMDPAGLYSNWPGWRIVAPSTPFDYVGLMNSALLCEDPVLVIEHVGVYGSSGPGPLDDFDYFIPLGKAKVVRPGTSFTVLSYLAMTPAAVEAADQMGVDAEVIDLRSLDRAGIDWETIGQSIRKTNSVVVVEEGPLTASYGAMLTDEIQRRFFDYLDQPVKRIHGGEASPSVSKVLERAAFVGLPEIKRGYADMMSDIGLGHMVAE
ncbi:MAG: MFS transporter [Rhodospirillales bacterium]|nr:MFS transporter [Rhodospirillales bacterium]